MIRAVLIVDVDRAVALVQRVYREIGINAELLQSFVSALWVFVEKGLVQSDDLEKPYLLTEEKIGITRWLYLRDNKLLFVIIAEEIDNPAWLRKKVEILRDEFYKEFPEMEVNQEVELQNWDTNYEKWQEFEGTIDTLVNEWTTAEEVTYDAAVLDILEVYQQLISPLLKAVPDSVLSGVIDKIVALADENNINLRITGKNINLLDTNFNQFSTDGAKHFLVKLFDYLLSVVRENSNKTEFENLLRKKIFPVIRKEITRIHDYELSMDILPKILV